MNKQNQTTTSESKAAKTVVTMVTVLLVASTLTTVALQPASAAAPAVDAQACETVPPAADHRQLAGTSAAVERLYRALFLRSPTEAGLGYWTQRIQSGRTDLREVAGLFAQSDEFTNRYGRLSDPEFVELLYCNVLGRRHQSSGSRYWQNQLAGDAERSDVTLQFSQSNEFVTRSLVVADEPALSDADGTETAPLTAAKPTSKKPTSKETVVDLGEAPDRLAMVDEPAPVATKPRADSPNEKETVEQPVSDNNPAGDEDPAADPTTADEPLDTDLNSGSDPVAEKPVDEQQAAGQLVWQEEFTTLDTTIWRPEHSTYGDGNNELQCYRPQNVSVRDGSLILTAKEEVYTCPNGSTRQATSGMVRGAVHFEYGQRIEFRVKVNPADENDQRGLWPALWASSWNGGGWPTGGEFDWLEYVGTTPTRANHAIHYADTSGKHRHVSKAIDMGEKFSDRWHTIAFDWSDELVWYLDGEEVQRLDPDTIGAKGSPFGPNARPVTQIKLNFALGGNWPGPLGPTTLDAEGSTNFAIDYVRIYNL